MRVRKGLSPVDQASLHLQTPRLSDCRDAPERSTQDERLQTHIGPCTEPVTCILPGVKWSSLTAFASFWIILSALLIVE